MLTQSLISNVALPPGTKLLSAKGYGSSSWTITGKIVVQNPNGSEQKLFLKVRLANISLFPALTLKG